MTAFYFLWNLYTLSRYTPSNRSHVVCIKTLNVFIINSVVDVFIKLYTNTSSTSHVMFLPSLNFIDVVNFAHIMSSHRSQHIDVLASQLKLYKFTTVHRRRRSTSISSHRIVKNFLLLMPTHHNFATPSCYTTFVNIDHIMFHISTSWSRIMIMKLTRVMSRGFRLHQNFVTRDIVTQASCNFPRRQKTLHAYRSLIVSISLSH